jgi:chemotaxis protein MotB
MARHSWETEVAPKRSTGSRVRRFFLGLLAIGVATFVAAYYVPLLRAHQALTRRTLESTTKADSLEQKTAKLEADLKTATAERDKLAQAESDRASSSKEGKDKVGTLETALSTSLKKHTAKGIVTVTSTVDAVVVSLRSDVLFPGDRPELNPGGAAILCDASRAAGSHRVEISIGTQSLAGAPAESAWAYAAEAGGRVATQLEDKCGRKAGLVSVTVRNDAGTTTPGHTVDLRIVP